jgi:hypothetical protein
MNFTEFKHSDPGTTEVMPYVCTCTYCKDIEKVEGNEAEIPLLELPPDYVVGKLPVVRFKALHHKCGIELEYTTDPHVHRTDLKRITSFTPHQEFSRHPR